MVFRNLIRQYILVKSRQQTQVRMPKMGKKKDSYDGHVLTVLFIQHIELNSDPKL